MAKKRKAKKAKRITPRKPVSPEEFAARLARAGSAGLDLLVQFEERVRIDPGLWAAPFGATQEQMLASVEALRGMLLAETLNSSVAAAGVS